MGCVERKLYCSELAGVHVPDAKVEIVFPIFEVDLLLEHIDGLTARRKILWVKRRGDFVV